MMMTTTSLIIITKYHPQSENPPFEVLFEVGGKILQFIIWVVILFLKRSLGKFLSYKDKFDRLPNMQAPLQLHNYTHTKYIYFNPSLNGSPVWRIENSQDMPIELVRLDICQSWGANSFSNLFYTASLHGKYCHEHLGKFSKMFTAEKNASYVYFW